MNERIDWIAHVQPSTSPKKQGPHTLLGILARAGLPVAPGFVIPQGLLVQIFTQKTLKSEIERLAKEIQLQKLETATVIAKVIQQHFLQHRLPIAIQHELQQFYTQLHTAVHATKKEGLNIVIDYSDRFAVNKNLRRRYCRHW
jgi:phosphoenolpyruvate synthase/pyruvate phosphate dikinase